MDYTNNPNNNKTPDITNYQFLYALYGLVPGAAPYTPPTEAPSATPATTSTMAGVTDEDTGDLDQEENDNGDAKDKDKVEKDRDGRRRKTRRMAHDEDEPLEEWLQAAVDAAKASLEEMDRHPNQQDAVAAAAASNSGRKWRLLRQAAHGESHEIELEHGYRFQVHKLYA